MKFLVLSLRSFLRSKFGDGRKDRLRVRPFLRGSSITTRPGKFSIKRVNKVWRKLKKNHLEVKRCAFEWAQVLPFRSRRVQF